MILPEIMDFGPNLGRVIGNVTPSVVGSLGDFLFYRCLERVWALSDGCNGSSSLRQDMLEVGAHDYLGDAAGLAVAGWSKGRIQFVLVDSGEEWKDHGMGLVWARWAIVFDMSNNNKVAIEMKEVG